MRIVIGLVTMVVMTVMLVACGSDSDGPAAPVVLEGVFVDSAVSGLEYTSGGQTGVTDSSGTFRYEKGKSVEFRIGNVVIGSATGTAVMTPVTIVSGASGAGDQTVLNIARFLQSLDSDGDVSNGITISDTTAGQLETVEFDFSVESAEFESDVADQLPEVVLVSADSAISHLNESINRLESGFAMADLTGTWVSTGVYTPGENATTANELANYGAEAGTLVVGNDGAFQYQIKNSSETESGTLSISPMGIVSTSTESDHVGWYMNSGKDVMTLVFDNTTYHEQGKIIFVKQAAIYSQSDLTGTWNVVTDLTPGDGATGNQLENFSVDTGSMVIDADGSFLWTTLTENETGTLSISEDGEITTGSADDHLGWYMNAGKDVMILVFDNTTDREQGTILFVKEADTYTASDLAGTWYSTGDLTPGDGAAGDELVNFSVDTGTLVVENNGSFKWTTRTDVDTGTLSLSGTGDVEIAGGDDCIGWYMNASKNVMVLVFNNVTYHEQGMIVLVK